MTRPREISPAEAAVLVGQGAVLVDIREAAERREGAIPGSLHAPLSSLASASIGAPAGSAIIFHCKTGGRTKTNAEALQAKAGGREVYLLTGGIEAWQAAGQPVRR